MTMRDKRVLAIDTATENCSVALSLGDKVVMKSEVAPQKHANLVLKMVDELLNENSVKREDIDAVGFGAGPGSFTGVRIAVSSAQALALGLDVEVFGISDLKLLAVPELLGDVCCTQVSGLSDHCEAKDTDSASEPQPSNCSDASSNCGCATSKRFALCAADARMGEVYYALFEKQGTKIVSLIEEKVTKPEDAVAELKNYSQAMSDANLVAAGTGISILLEHGLKDVLSADALAKIESSLTDNTLRLYPEADAIIKSAMVEGCELTDPALAEPLYCRNEVTWKKISEQ